MKKIMLLFLIIFSFSFSKYNDISNIRSLVMSVKEDINSKGKKNTSKIYLIKYNLPNELKKETLEPKTHKGEIFIYKNNKKITYLPILNEKIEEEASIDENQVSNFITFFQKKYKSDETFKKKYNISEKLIIKKENLNLEILEFKIFSNYKLPVIINIYENDMLIGTLTFSNIEINRAIPKSEFDI